METHALCALALHSGLSRLLLPNFPTQVSTQNLEQGVTWLLANRFLSTGKLEMEIEPLGLALVQALASPVQIIALHYLERGRETKSSQVFLVPGLAILAAAQGTGWQFRLFPEPGLALDSIRKMWLLPEDSGQSALPAGQPLPQPESLIPLIWLNPEKATRVLMENGFSDDQARAVITQVESCQRAYLEIHFKMVDGDPVCEHTVVNL